MNKITVIGSFVMDMVATMDFFPEAGQSVSGSTIHQYAGGKGVNQCISAARLGGSVEMVGILGSDANGDVFRDILSAEKIKHDKVFKTDIPTAVAQVQINKAGQNRICVIPSANYKFDLSHLDAADESIKDSSLINYDPEMGRFITIDDISYLD